MAEVVDYKNIDLTENDKKEGWRIEKCHGNTHKIGCGKQFRSKSWYEPSGCPHCSATFVD